MVQWGLNVDIWDTITTRHHWDSAEIHGQGVLGPSGIWPYSNFPEYLTLAQIRAPSIVFLAGRASPSQESHSKTFPLVSVPWQNKTACSDPSSQLQNTSNLFKVFSTALDLPGTWLGWQWRPPVQNFKTDGHRRVVGAAPLRLRQREAEPLSGSPRSTPRETPGWL